MPVRIIDSLTTNPQVDEVFSDASVIQAMLRFELRLPMWKVVWELFL